MRRAHMIPVDQLDLSDPEKTRAAQLVREHDVIDLALLAPGQQKPRDDEGACVVINAAKLERYGTWDALRKLVGPNWVIRSDREEPCISAEHARSRGFTEEEITRYLRPWVAETDRAADRLEAEAIVKYAEAQDARAKARWDAAGLPPRELPGAK